MWRKFSKYTKTFIRLHYRQNVAPMKWMNAKEWDYVNIWAVKVSHLSPMLRVASVLVTVLMMCMSLKRATPTGARSWATGQTSHFTPAMVIRGSLGGITITIALMSGMEMHVSSPKHLQVAKRRGGRQENKCFKTVSALIGLALLKIFLSRLYLSVHCFLADFTPQWDHNYVWIHLFLMVFCIILNIHSGVSKL